MAQGALMETIVQGFFHPLSGADHLLAMVSVGVWSARMGGRAVYVLPGAFLLAMLAGAIAGAAGVPLPGVEAGIGASVIALGLAVALALRPGPLLGAGIVFAFALLHGHAHGTELGALALPGLLLATGLLHGAGVAIGARLPAWAARVAGAGMALCGVAFIS
jgi:urease accessory protein